jgi:hypothetical protein
MARGGARQGAGRKKGQITAHRKLANEATVKAVGDGETPLAYLLKVMRDIGQDDARRLDAAKAAAPFVHPKLATVEHKGDADNPLEFVTRVELVAPRI